MRAEDYSSTEPRERMLWLEFDAAPENPRDDLFGRVLSRAPDPMLTRGLQVDVPPEPPLPVDPEWLRVIRPGQADDRAGLARCSRCSRQLAGHFLLPLPPDLTATRELSRLLRLRVARRPRGGMVDRAARFGPAFASLASSTRRRSSRARDSDSVGALVAAPFATPVADGRNLLPLPPATQIWFMLYAQVVQADGADHRNILLARRRGTLNRDRRTVEADRSASGRWTEAEIAAALAAYRLPSDSPLSVLAAEVLPEVEPPADPLGASLGEVRILRTSPLIKLSDVCVQPRARRRKRSAGLAVC